GRWGRAGRRSRCGPFRRGRGAPWRPADSPGGAARTGPGCARSACPGPYPLRAAAPSRAGRGRPASGQRRRAGPRGRPGAAPEALARLASWSGGPWRVRWHGDYHTVAFLNGRTAPLGGLDRLNTEAKSFVVRYGALFGVPGAAEVEHAATTQDDLGMRHVRFT